jgi:hypothetical protein
MTTPIAYALLNGARMGFSSIEPKIILASGSSLIFGGFKSLNYKRARTREEARSNSPDPIGKTVGENAYTGDLEVYAAEALQIINFLGGAGYGDVFFALAVTYLMNGFDTQVDTLLGCTLDEFDSSNSQGPANLTRKFNLSPLKLLVNGLDDLAIPLTAPPA